MDRDSKLRKLNTFRCSLPHVSNSALATLLARARAGDLPVLSRRNDISDARDANVLQNTPYGRLIESVDLVAYPAGTVTVEMVNPMANICLAAKTRYFSELLRVTFARRPPSFEHPWKLCLYADEAKPGAAMKQDNKRVLQNVYWSFLDFGAAALSKEDFWFTACTVRSFDVNKISAKMSQLVAKVLKRFFSTTGNNLRFGVHFTLPDDTALKIFGSFECMLADESALHGIWYNMGSSGVKCCVECWMIVNKHWEGAEYLTSEDELKPYNKVLDAKDLKLHTKASVTAIMHDLQAAKAERPFNQGEFHKKETRLGWKYDPHSILCDHESASIVDTSAHNCYDWSHNVCQGIFQLVLWLVLDSLSQFGVKYSMLHEYLQQWLWPRRLGAKCANGSDLFSPKRSTSHKDAKLIKAKISEVLSVHIVIAHWLRMVVLKRGLCVKECKAYLTLSTLISMLWHCAKLSIAHERIAEATSQFLHAFVDAFGDEDMTWKFHAILHHAKNVKLYGWPPHTITMERKHKGVLQLAHDKHNTNSMDTVLREVVNKHLNVLEHGHWLNLSIGLIKPTAPNRKLQTWLNEAIGNVAHTTSAAARISEYDICHKGDIVCVQQDSIADWFAAQVLFFGCSSDVLYAAVSPYSLVEKHATYSTWADDSDPIIVYISEILDSLVYSRDGHTIVVLHPLALHGM